MADSLEKLAGKWGELEEQLARLRATAGVAAEQIGRLRADAKALMFHLRRGREKKTRPALVVLLGGTGTGKSTVTNRLLEANVSAASFKRTFTSGAVAVARDDDVVPEGWLGLEHRVIGGDALPARGEAGLLAIVAMKKPLTEAVTLIDTPDLDGDQPAHHAEADRAFRWGEAIIFLVTPEKYQMTELLPYYRLAQRYGLPAVFVMNKLEEAAVLEDFAGQLSGRGWEDAKVFALPRDDAGYEPPREMGLEALRRAVIDLNGAVADQKKEERQSALANRSADLLGRLRDQIIAPLRDQRRAIDSAIASLRAMAMPEAGVDVSPVTRQLQRRMQEQSVLYLMGPQRILDRVRQVPGMLLRLPRTAFDLLRGEKVAIAQPSGPNMSGGVPDFAAMLADQFTILQSRVDDVIAGTAGTSLNGQSMAQVKIPAEQAAKIGREELAELEKWLREKWDAPPRDTRILQKLLSVLPGGKAIARWSEAAPYLLTVVMASTGALFGHVDLIILGSFTVATWLGEKLSNEVTARSRAANARISARFTRLAQEQVEKICRWLDEQAPTNAQLMRLDRQVDELAELSARD